MTTWAIIVVSAGLGALVGIVVGFAIGRARYYGLETARKMARSSRISEAGASSPSAHRLKLQSMESIQESAFEDSMSIHDHDLHRTFRIAWRDIKVEKKVRCMGDMWIAKINFGTTRNVPCVLKNGDDDDYDGKGSPGGSISINESVIEEMHQLGRHPHIIFTFGFCVLTKQMKRLVDIDARWLVVSEWVEHGTLGARIHKNLWDYRQIVAARRRKKRGGGKTARESFPVPSWTSRVRWSLDIAEGLVHLHHHGFSHGNLSSASCYMFIQEDRSGDRRFEDDDDAAFVFRVKLGDPSLRRVASVRHRRPASGSSSPSSKIFRRGDTVKIIKHGRQEGKLAEVTDPNWGSSGRVKVRMHRDRSVKSYTRSEIAHLRRGDVRGDSFWGERPSDDDVRRASMIAASESNDDISERIWWTAPEMLKTTTISATVRGCEDVFAFGVILSEIYSLSYPWCTIPPRHERIDKEEEEAAGGVDKQAKRRRASNASARQRALDAWLRGERPNLKVDASAPHGIYHLLQRCWRHLPEHRPRSTCLLRRLREIDSCHRSGASVMDTHGRPLRTHSSMIKHHRSMTKTSASDLLLLARSMSPMARSGSYYYSSTS